MTFVKERGHPSQFCIPYPPVSHSSITLCTMPHALCFIQAQIRNPKPPIESLSPAFFPPSHLPIFPTSFFPALFIPPSTFPITPSTPPSPSHDLSRSPHPPVLLFPTFSPSHLLNFCFSTFRNPKSKIERFPLPHSEFRLPYLPFLFYSAFRIFSRGIVPPYRTTTGPNSSSHSAITLGSTPYALCLIHSPVHTSPHLNQIWFKNHIWFFLCFFS